MNTKSVIPVLNEECDFTTFVTVDEIRKCDSLNEDYYRAASGYCVHGQESQRCSSL